MSHPQAPWGVDATPRDPGTPTQRRLLTQRHRLGIALVSRDLARACGRDVLAFSLTVALGLRYLGATHLASRRSAALGLAVGILFASLLERSP